MLFDFVEEDGTEEEGEVEAPSNNASVSSVEECDAEDENGYCADAKEEEDSICGMMFGGEDLLVRTEGASRLVLQCFAAADVVRDDENAEENAEGNGAVCLDWLLGVLCD